MAAVYNLLYGCFTPVCCSCKIVDRKKKTETPDFSDEIVSNKHIQQKPRSNSISEEEKKDILQKYQYMMKIKEEKKFKKNPTENICSDCSFFSFFPFFEQKTEKDKTI